MSSNEPMRLNKYLALQLGISRREADNYIADGRVKVNNSIAILGSQVSPTDDVTVNDKKVDGGTAFEYIILNKPVGYVCSRKQQGDNPTIYSILPQRYHALKTVGRLDRDSSGLVILTNDGDFAFQMTHPKFYKIKVYKITLDRDLEPLHQQMISDHGVILEDGPSKFELEKLDDSRRDSWRVTMSEGRNRQIRRTFDSLGYTVTTLHRTNFGPYTLDQLKAGEFAETKKI